jgi:hypothetical protein
MLGVTRGAILKATEQPLDTEDSLSGKSKGGTHQSHQNTPLTGIGATRHRQLPLIGRVAGQGFQPTNETSALQNLNIVTID